jgi:nuclear GTP-binding protein
VAAEPGWTKELQSVAVERGLRIIDSPGVIFDDSDPSLATTQPSSISQASRILLLNVLSASSMPDPIQIVQAILSRTSHETLQSLYSLPSFSSDSASAPGGGDDDEAMEDMPIVTKFLTMLALTSGRLLPGGTPNLEAAATQVLRDWNSGKIPYFTPVPEFHPSVRPSDTPGAENVGDMKVVTEWKPAFDLGGLLDAADQQAWNEDPIIDEDGAEYMAEDG